jgi:hypothetical protein
MRYLLMLYADEKAGAAIPKAEMDGYMQMMFAYQAALEKAGAFVMTSPLRPTTAAKTVYTEAGELKVHDGPYAETREQFGGLYLIEARDMDEALGWARKCPGAQWGHVEVRELVPGY